MKTLQTMFEHNDWANQRVMAVVADLNAAIMGDDAPGTYGSIEKTVKHLVGVEEVYLNRIQGKDIGASGSQEEYFGHSLDWFRQRSLALGQIYATLLTTASEDLLERELTMPWISVPLTVREGLIQVLTHSAQHRAQILSTLGERGQTIPDVDYVVMRMERG